MTLDLMHLAYLATGGYEPFINKYVTASLMPVMVGLGGIYRFITNEVRGRPLNEGNTNNIDKLQRVIGITSFTASGILFLFLAFNITYPIIQELCGPSEVPNANGKCPITDANHKADADAVIVLVLVWLGYPLVSLASRFSPWRKNHGFDETAWNSLFKDVAFAVLDVSSKGGLALYVCYRTTWL